MIIVLRRLRGLSFHANLGQKYRILMIVGIPVSKSKSSFVLLSFSSKFFDCVAVVLVVAIILSIFIDHIRL